MENVPCCVHYCPACDDCKNLSSYNGGSPPFSIKNWYYAKAARDKDPDIIETANRLRHAEDAYKKYQKREKTFFGRMINSIIGHYAD